MIGDTNIENNKIVRKQKPILKNGYCKPCFSRTNNLCCKQAAPTTTFKSNATLKTYQIFHPLNCIRSYIICSLECLKCQIQYVVKSGTDFKIRLHKKEKTQNKKDVTRKDSIPASNDFDIEGHNFKIHAKFILIEQLNQTNLDKLTLRKRLKIRKYFWILKLKK